MGSDRMKKTLLTAMLLGCMAVFFLPAAAHAMEPKLAVSDAYAGSVYHERLTAVELTGDWRTDIVNVALSQIGYHEGFSKADYDGACATGWGNYTEYGAVYGGLDAEWCAMFVSWCARQAGIPTYAVNTAARAAIGKTDSENTQYMFHTSISRPGNYAPCPGDLVFFTDNGAYANHVGIVVKAEETGIWTVEGNALNAVRLNFYPSDSGEILYYGTYTVRSLAETDDFSATELVFVNSDGTYGFLPDSSTIHYRFTSLWAVHGREFAMPTYPFAKGEALLAGYRVQRAEDGLWYCTDGCWHSAEAISRRGYTLCLMKCYGTEKVEGYLTEAETLRLYCVWSENGVLTEDSAVTAAMARDESGWCAFADLPEGVWYYESARQAAFGGWLEETDSLRPLDCATRGEFLLMLYRMQDCPETETDCPFTDVPRGSELERAAAWAYSAGIAEGSSANRLEPEGLLTREQVVTILYRFLGGETPETAAEFPDGAQVGDWAQDAMRWGVSRKFVQGIPDETGTLFLRPKQNLNRAEAVTLLCRIAGAEIGKKAEESI